MSMQAIPAAGFCYMIAFAARDCDYKMCWFLFPWRARCYVQRI